MRIETLNVMTRPCNHHPRKVVTSLYEEKLICDQINRIRVAQGHMLKELYNHYSSKIQSFEYIRVDLKGPKTCNIPK